MDFKRPVARRPFIVFCALATLLATCGTVLAADAFPFDREYILDGRPMRPVKRMPVVTVASSGEATIDLWCKTVRARFDVSDAAIRIEAGPLPEALPQYMADGQCTPERMQADADMLTALTQVTAWRKHGSALELAGPTTLKFRLSDH